MAQTFTDDLQTYIQIRRHSRTKKATFKLDKARQKIFLTIPPSLKEDQISELLHRYQDWILEQIPKLPPSLYLTSGSELPILGLKRRLSHTGPQGDGPLLTISHILIPGEAHQFGRRLEQFLKREARDYFSTLAAKKASTRTLKIRKVTVKNTLSQWGSCTSDKTLCFCWRLFFAPEFVVDYVIAHEVAHLEEMNHSEQFWAICDSLTPHRVQATEWLKHHGGTLHQFKFTDGT